MNTQSKRWPTLIVVALLSLTISGCSFFSEKFERLRSRNDAQPQSTAVAQPDATAEEQKMFAATPPTADVPDTAAVTGPTVAVTPGGPILDIDDKVLVKRIQTKLNLLGFNAGEPDGVAGPKTLMALARFRDMAGVLSNPELGDMLQQVVSANEAGVELEKPWWQRRLPSKSGSEETTLAEPVEDVIASADQDLTSESQIVATAARLREQNEAQMTTTAATDTTQVVDTIDNELVQSADLPAPTTLTEPDNALEIPPSAGASAQTEDSQEQLATDNTTHTAAVATDMKALNEEAYAVNKRLVGNGTALPERSDAVLESPTEPGEPAVVDSIDLSGLALPAIGVSSSTDPQSATFLARVKGAWVNTKRRVRSTFIQQDTPALQSQAPSSIETTNPNIN